MATMSRESSQIRTLINILKSKNRNWSVSLTTYAPFLLVTTELYRIDIHPSLIIVSTPVLGIKRQIVSTDLSPEDFASIKTTFNISENSLY